MRFVERAEEIFEEDQGINKDHTVDQSQVPLRKEQAAPICRATIYWHVAREEAAAEVNAVQCGANPSTCPRLQNALGILAARFVGVANVEALKPPPEDWPDQS